MRHWHSRGGPARRPGIESSSRLPRREPQAEPTQASSWPEPSRVRPSGPSGTLELRLPPQPGHVTAPWHSGDAGGAAAGPRRRPHTAGESLTESPTPAESA